jgi:hypothetical protein
MTTKSKKDYPDPDLVFKGVRVMWARTKEDNPYPASKGTKSNGATFRTAERWSFDIVLNDAQAEVAKAKQAYVKTKTDQETGETYHFLNLSRNTKNFEGLKVAPFFIVAEENGERLDVEMANGTVMDVEIYLGDDINEQSGARKARLKRGVVTNLIPYTSEGGGEGASVKLPDSSETTEAPAKVTASKAAKAPAKAKVDSSDLEDDIPF